MEKLWWEESKTGKKKKKHKSIQKVTKHKRKDATAQQCILKKLRKNCMFPMICGTARSTSRLAKGAGANPSGGKKIDYHA